jgi:transcriptional regulator with XRE-family HTH domain
MTPEEARAVLTKLGWTQLEAARQLGISARHMRRLVRPGGVWPASLARLLRLLAARRKAPPA